MTCATAAASITPKRQRADDSSVSSESSSLVGSTAPADTEDVHAATSDRWYRPEDRIAPFMLSALCANPDAVQAHQLAVISRHYRAAEQVAAANDMRVVTFKNHFVINYHSQCIDQRRYWRIVDLYFRDFSLPKIPDMLSGTVGCYERHLKDPENLVGVARALWAFAAPRCPHGVEIILCPPSPLSDASSAQDGSFYAYLSPDGSVISETEAVGFLHIRMF